MMTIATDVGKFGFM